MELQQQTPKNDENKSTHERRISFDFTDLENVKVEVSSELTPEELAHGLFIMVREVSLDRWVEALRKHDTNLDKTETLTKIYGQYQKNLIMNKDFLEIAEEQAIKKVAELKLANERKSNAPAISALKGIDTTKTVINDLHRPTSNS